jgi:CRISPR-associated protein Cmr1
MKPGKCAIAPSESATVSLALPEDDQARTLLSALDLMDLYGAIGGRSRNGWGSFAFRRDGFDGAGEVPRGVSRDWREALSLDWPHAVGADDRSLIWQTPPCPDWKTAMRALAQVKIGLRTQFKFTTGRNAPSPELRHWLAYPVTNHDVAGWKRQNLRLPNTLRFKLRTLADGNVVGVVFHMPCRPPDSFLPSKDTLVSLWRDVHSFLDKDPNGLKLQRIPH